MASPGRAYVERRQDLLATTQIMGGLTPRRLPALDDALLANHPNHGWLHPYRKAPSRHLSFSNHPNHGWLHPESHVCVQLHLLATTQILGGSTAEGVPVVGAILSVTTQIMGGSTDRHRGPF